jgi:hypothetical protein
MPRGQLGSILAPPPLAPRPGDDDHPMSLSLCAPHVMGTEPQKTKGRAAQAAGSLLGRPGSVLIQLRRPTLKEGGPSGRRGAGLAARSPAAAERRSALSGASALWAYQPRHWCYGLVPGDAGNGTTPCPVVALRLTRGL